MAYLLGALGSPLDLRRVRCYCWRAAHTDAPCQSTATTGSSPTTQASWPGGKEAISPGPTSSSVPSAMMTWTVPPTWYCAHYMLRKPMTLLVPVARLLVKPRLCPTPDAEGSETDN